MSSNNNTLLVLGIGVVALYLLSRQATPVRTVSPASGLTPTTLWGQTLKATTPILSQAISTTLQSWFGNQPTIPAVEPLPVPTAEPTYGWVPTPSGSYAYVPSS